MPIAIMILGLLNAFSDASIFIRWPGAGRHVLIAFSAAVALFLLQLVGPFGDRKVLPHLQGKPGIADFAAIVIWASYLTLGVMSCLFIFSAVADVFAIGWKLAVPPANPAAFDHALLLVLGVLTISTTALGVWQAAAGPAVRRVTVPLANLPASFDGFRIVQISDLHVSATIGRRYVENVVRLANSLHPDLIALTGDFADGLVAEMKDKVAPLEALTAPHGKFFITGNHEYYWGADAWMAEQRRLGARVLANEHVVIRKDGEEIILAGVIDYSTRKSDPQQALAGAPPGRIKILLAHQPITYRMAEAAGFDLQLSGHTHGGQYFPFNILIRLFQRYYKGLNRYRNLWIYVNRGAGYWGPPLRTLTPTEIALITLRAA